MDISRSNGQITPIFFLLLFTAFQGQAGSIMINPTLELVYLLVITLRYCLIINVFGIGIIGIYLLFRGCQLTVVQLSILHL